MFHGNGGENDSSFTGDNPDQLNEIYVGKGTSYDTLTFDNANTRVGLHLGDAASVNLGVVGSFSLQVSPNEDDTFAIQAFGSGDFGVQGFSGVTAGSSLYLSSGTVHFQDDSGANLAVTVDYDGKAIFESSEHLASLSLQGNAQLTAGGNKVLTLGALSIYAGQLDLADNGLIVNYSGTSSYAAINALIASAYDAVAESHWFGSGLTSSTAAADASGATALGAIDNAVSDYSAFHGASVGATVILVGFTYCGDANLDGKVDATDDDAIAAATSANLAGWAIGDYNFDGFVTTADTALAAAGAAAQGPQATLAPVTAYEGQASATVTLWDQWTDARHKPWDLNYSVFSNDNTSLVTSTSIDATTGVLTLNFAAHHAGTANLVIRAQNAEGIVKSATLQVHVVRTDSPVLNAGLQIVDDPALTPGTTGDEVYVNFSASSVVDGNATVQFTVTASAPDAGANLQFTLTDAPAGATITPITGTQTAQVSWVATAADLANVPRKFHVKVADQTNADLSDEHDFYADAYGGEAIPRAPIARDDLLNIVVDGVTTNFYGLGNVVANDSNLDVQNATKTIHVIDKDGTDLEVTGYALVSAQHGTFVIDDSGAVLSYVPNDADNVKPDSIRYYVVLDVPDGNGGTTTLTSNIAKVTTKVLTPPVTNSDVYSLVSTEIYGDTGVFLTLSVDAKWGLLRNDYDPNGEPLTIHIASGPTSGTVSVNEQTGALEYNTSYGEEPGWTHDSFTYYLTNSDGFRSQDTLVELDPFHYDLKHAAADATPVVQSGVLMVGGGTLPPAVPAQFLPAAGHGDIVYLDAAYQPRYSGTFMNLAASGTCNSIQEFLVTTVAQADSNQELLDAVSHAEGIFLGGGDQSRYLELWKGTKLWYAIQDRINHGAVIGGTSAGMAVMAGHAYHEFPGGRGLRSSEALQDPFSHVPFNKQYSDTVIDGPFLNIPALSSTLRDVLTDTHVDQFDRVGRDVAFLAQMATRNLTVGTPKLIGAFAGGAVFIDANGIGTIYAQEGKGVYFLAPSPNGNANAVVQKGVPLTFATGGYFVHAGGVFDVKNWQPISDQATDAIEYDAVNGVLNP